MFHIEVRERSHRLSRLNMSERELTAMVLAPWVRGDRIELGERTWRPDEASITIVEGPEIPIGAMTLGRGWPTAVREGREVTTAMIAAVHRSLSSTAGASEGAAEAPGAGLVAGGRPATLETAAAEPGLLADSLSLELLRRLSEGSMPLHEVWKVSAERHTQLPASRSLEIASQAVTSLARSKLIALTRTPAGEGGEPMSAAEVEAALGDIESWSDGDAATALWVSRA